MQDLRSELAEILDEAEWEWLEPHVKRDVVVVVDKNLDLLDVGVAIASDNTSCVQHWIGEQLIQKPSPTQMQNWSSDRAKRFNALIVQPYVLVQELAASITP
ncbi:DUF2288 family protein [Microcoleus sp. FACHB-831]|uniref:DUF2288 domain-containing protein n=1 Tax=Microcoleus sp. FACHB-831 TaxID=2692827 RepID=UPI0016832D84|nr:DUF2288 domain-containing protein [Microcoleus sp. FACHB-831]MBD1919971.1 DUF2288 family protein [Microcoleus sp. FACHB-831]